MAAKKKRKKKSSGNNALGLEKKLAKELKTATSKLAKIKKIV